MKTEEELRQFCEKRLAEKQKSLEDLRIKTYKKYSTLFLSAIIVISLLTFFLFLLNIVVFVMFIVGFLILSIGGTALYLNNIRKEYNSICKNEIITEIIKFYNTNLTYDQNKGIMQQAVEISRLFDPSKNYESRDYVEGQMGKTFIQFSYVQFDIADITYSSSFNGIFMIASFNKYFNGNYIVLPETHFTPTGKTMLSDILVRAKLDVSEVIKLEDPEFNQLFRVYGSDQLEARYIITPAMMSRMIDFHSRVNNNVYFSFTRSRFFMSFDSGDRKIFEPSLSSPLQLDEIMQWAREIGYAINIVDEFNLNSHIWSKQ